MIIYYILLFLSALLFSGQFLATKKYQLYNGSSFLKSIKLCLFAYLTIALFFFLKGSISLGKINFGFSWFTFFITVLVALITFTCMILSVKVLSICDMSIYSVYMMMGGMVLPSLVGLIFYNEKFSIIKFFAFCLMLIAILFTIDFKNIKSTNKKAYLYYFGVFILNGLIGVFFTIHQNNTELTASPILTDGVLTLNNDLFLTWYGISTVLVCILILIGSKLFYKNTQKTNESINKKFLILSIGLGVAYGLCNGIGNFFIAIATQPNALGSFITFPICNGGTILFSTLMGLILFKEKISFNKLASVCLVIISTILFMFN